MSRSPSLTGNVRCYGEASRQKGQNGSCAGGRWADAGRVSTTGKSLQIQRARADVAPAAYRIVEEYYRKMSVVMREDQQKFTEEYFGDGRGFWLALEREQIAGCIGLRRIDLWAEQPKEAATREEKTIPGRAEIKRMYVREEWRGHGVAQRLLEAAEEFARAAGCGWIYLDTTDDMKAAARLYERNGYVRCERYNENSQATIFMRKKL